MKNTRNKVQSQYYSISDVGERVALIYGLGEKMDTNLTQYSYGQPAGMLLTETRSEPFTGHSQEVLFGKVLCPMPGRKHRCQSIYCPSPWTVDLSQIFPSESQFPHQLDKEYGSSTTIG